MQDRVNGCITNEDTVKAVQEFEQIIQNKKSDIVQLATSCGQRHRVVSDIVWLRARANISEVQRERTICLRYGLEIPGE